MSRSPNPRFTAREFAETGGDPQRRKFSRGKVLALAAAAFVLVFLIPGLILLVVDDDRDARNPAGTGPTTSTDSADFGEVTWKRVGRTELPYSSTAGPFEESGVAASKFTRSKAGAVIAAWQTSTRLTLIESGDGMYQTHFVGTDEERRQFQAGAAEIQAGMEPDQLVPRVLAWREHFFSPEMAAFDFAMPGESDSDVRLVRLAVVWIGDDEAGDWKFQPGLMGRATPGPVAADSINPGNGWNLFGGV